MLVQHKLTVRFSGWRLRLALLFALVGITLLMAPPVYAADTTISGVVSDETGNPLGEIGVILYRMVGHPGLEIPRWEKAETFITPPTGNYQFTVTPGTYYTVRFVDGRVPPQYVSEFYGDVQDIWSAPLINLAAEEQRTDVNAQLALGGNIAGRVTNAAGQPATGVVVQAYPVLIDEAGQVSSGPLSGSSEVNADGTYYLTVAHTGNVRVEFTDPNSIYRPEFYADLYQDSYPYRYLFPQARDIPVAIGATTPGIDAVLEKLGRIAGLVTDNSGQPLATIYVAAYREHTNGSGFTEWSEVASMFTKPDGAYNFALLLPGNYRVCFNHGLSVSPYAPTCYGDMLVERATTVTINLGETTTIPTMQLGRYGQIRGRVTNAAGQPLSGAEVTAYWIGKDEAGNAGVINVQFAFTDENGNYAFDQLYFATYRLSASGSPLEAYTSEFYPDVATLAEASDFVVGPDSRFAGIDFALAEATATIHIVLDNQPDSRQDIRFTGDLGAFRLDDAQPDDGDRYSNRATFVVKPGNYTVRELVPYGRLLTGLSCSNGLSWDGVNPSITLTVTGNEEVTCTFVNERVVNLLAQVYHDRNGNGVRNFSDLGLRGWDIAFYADGTLIRTQTTNFWGLAELTGVRAGNYTICTTLKPDWRNTQPGQLDPVYGQPCYSITLQPGQNALASFVNIFSKGGNSGGGGQQFQPTAEEAGVAISLAAEETDDSGYEVVAPAGGQVFLPLIEN